MSRWGLVGLCLAASALVVSCARSPGPPPAPPESGQGALSFSSDGIQMSDGDCTNDNQPCANVDLNWVVAAGSPAANAINAWVDARVRGLLVANLPKDIDGSAELDDLGQAFLDSYRDFRAAFPGSSQRWALEGQVTLAYHGGDLVSLRADQAADTGGAHPNQAVSWASFDARSGRRLVLSDLVTEPDAVEHLAELEFRRVRGLDAHTDLAAAGYTFPDNLFALPDNLARVDNGIAIRWNAYQIAPYAAGPTDLLLSTEQLGGLLRR